LPDFQNVLFEPRDHLLYVTLNRPERRNAIDPQTSYELLQAFTAFKETMPLGGDRDARRPGVQRRGRPGGDGGGFAGGTQTEFMKAPSPHHPGFECWKRSSPPSTATASPPPRARAGL
jgi:hypothetical protein